MFRNKNSIFSFREFKIIIFLVLSIIIFGVIGYTIIEGWGIIDALYMTVISITTVGFGEVHPLSKTGRMFTISIIIMGMVIFAYSIQFFGRVIVGGEIRNIFGRRRLENKISKLKNHFIVAGYGRMGKIVVEELLENGDEVIVVERDEDVEEELLNSELLYIRGDATDEDVLEKAQISSAKGLVAVLTNDSDNLYLVITAKGINPNLFVVSRATTKNAEKKLYRIGANKVICPYKIGGVRIANALVRPYAVDFMELTMAGMDIRMEEFKICNNSVLAGTLIRDSKLRENFGMIIIAIIREEGKYIYNPTADEKILPNDIIIVVGNNSSLMEIGNITCNET